MPCPKVIFPVNLHGCNPNCLSAPCLGNSTSRDFQKWEGGIGLIWGQKFRLNCEINLSNLFKGK